MQTCKSCLFSQRNDVHLAFARPFFLVVCLFYFLKTRLLCGVDVSSQERQTSTSISSFLSLQDDANYSGGKWIIRLKKGLASRCWENLILAMLGEQFMVGEEICGAVISVRYQVFNLSSC